MNAVITTAPTELAFREQRRKYLGGSDIAAVLGISPWKTPLQLWADKTTPPVEDRREDNLGAKTRGKRWEAVVAEMLVERLNADGHTVEIVSSNQRYLDPEVPHFAAEIDFEIRLDGEQEITNVELKTVHPFKMRDWGDSGSDECPVHYTAQVMWGLGITRRRRGILAPLFGADEIRAFPIEADDETIAGMRSQGLKFWNDHVLTKVAPSPSNLDDANRLFKAGEGVPLVANEDLVKILLRMRALDRETKAREAEWDQLEFLVKCAMREATELTLENGKTAITWADRAHTYLDQSALKEAHPKLHREFTRKGSSRVFTLKPFAWKE